MLKIPLQNIVPVGSITSPKAMIQKVTSAVKPIGMSQCDSSEEAQKINFYQRG
jgi:hypothetical protein